MIEISHLTKKYGDKTILDDVSLKLPDKGFVWVEGQNGAGKTTLLNILGLVDDGFEGEVEINKMSIKDYKTKDYLRKNVINYIFQKNNIVDFLNASENANLSNIIDGKPIKDLSYLSNKEFAHKSSSQLSDGEKILISLERGTRAGKSIYILDEVSSFLDEANETKVIECLKDISKTSLVIFVSHDSRVVHLCSDIVLNIDKTKITYISNEEQLWPSKDFDKKEDYIKQKRQVKPFFLLLYKIIRKNIIVFMLSITIVTMSCSFFAICLSSMTYNLKKSYSMSLKEGDYYNLVSNDNIYNAINKKTGLVFPADLKSGIKTQDKESLEAGFGDDVFYSFKSIFFDPNYSENKIIVSNDEFMALKNNGKIDGNNAVFNIFNYKVRCPYEIGNSDFSSKKKMNLKYAMSLVPESGIVVEKSLWNNNIFDFTNDEDVGKLFEYSYLFNLTYTSSSLFEKRVGEKLDVEPKNNEIFVGSEMEPYITNSSALFFNRDEYDLGAEENYAFVDMNKVFQDGVKIKENNALDGKIGEKEVIVSDFTFDSIVKETQKLPLKNWLHITKNNFDKAVSFMANRHMSYYKIDDIVVGDVYQNDLDEINYSMTGINRESSIIFGITFAFLIILFNMIFAIYIKKRNEKNKIILLSAGLNEKDTRLLFCSVCFIEMIVSAVLGLCFGAIRLESNYFNRNIEVLPKFSINIFVILIVCGLTLLSALISYVIFLRKSRNNN